MRILHIAPQNVAGVPITFVRAERKLGHDSRLVTMYRDPRGYEEDICLDLPLFHSPLVTFAKRVASPRHRRVVSHTAQYPWRRPPVWRPRKLEMLLIRFRELLWTPRVRRALDDHQANSFDVVQFDGGLDFFRDGRYARHFKSVGKQIVCCYTGSDLRTRGIVPAVDELCHVRVTVEYDHLQLYPGIQHVFFPFEPERMPPRQSLGDGKVRIGHSPSVRHAKGTAEILNALRALKRRRPEVEVVLIEGLLHPQAILRKATCDIFVDQIGDLGYGINALEALAMGIPVVTCLAPGFVERCPDHPFVEVQAHNLAERLEKMVARPDWRKELSEHGRDWLYQHHEATRVVRQIHELIASSR